MNKNNGGGSLMLRGSLPPPHQSGHTLPLTHRSKHGDGGRFGARSAAGKSFGASMSTSSFFTRHNPHPGRVRHIEGLLGVPICHVSDDGFQPAQRSLNTPERRSIYQAHHVPSTISEYPLFPTNSYGIADRSVLASKAIPFKKAPILPRWFQELKDISTKAGLQPGLALEQPQQNQTQTASYSKVTGRLNEAPSRAMTRSGPSSRAGRVQSRSGVFTGGINKQPDNEALVMELLSQILQTDSISTIQQWLMGATDREKDLVSDMIRAALITEEQVNNDQYMQDQYQNQYRRDEFLDNNKSANGAHVDRLIIEEQQQQQQQDQQQQQNKLPDINQPRTTSRLSDHLNLGPSQNSRFEPMAPVPEIDQDYVEYRSMDNTQRE